MTTRDCKGQDSISGCANHLSYFGLKIRAAEWHDKGGTGKVTFPMEASGNTLLECLGEEVDKWTGFQDAEMTPCSIEAKCVDAWDYDMNIGR